MCTTCGCGSPAEANEPDGAGAAGRHGAGDDHDAAHRHGHDHGHDHGHGHGHGHDHDHDHGHGNAHGAGQQHADDESARRVRVERDILSKNDGFARRNRAHFGQHGIFALNLLSSPGSGKTSVLVRTIEQLRGRQQVAVIEGDQQTSLDAERIQGAGAPAFQINTGKGCHLDAHAVGHAIDHLAPPDGSLLLIENVGNLVCPAAFDLGEAYKVVVLSVTEGEDKPLKYPDMFRAAQLMLLNKIDLLPHLEFDVRKTLEFARRVNPALQVIALSARTLEGFDRWLAWIEHESAAWRTRQADLARLERRGATVPGTAAANG
jgi:hydrogenase nickel incorporation protein HypB